MEKKDSDLYENGTEVNLRNSEEIIYFLNEYKTIEDLSEYYYIVPYNWIISWDKFITENNG